MLGWDVNEVVKVLKKIDDIEKWKECISLPWNDSRPGNNYSINVIVDYLKNLESGTFYKYV